MWEYSIKSIKGSPGRSAVMIALSVLLSFCVLAGSLWLLGLRSGLRSLDERLGADVMVVPYEVSTQSYLEDAILMGNTGYYYMSDQKMTDIAEKIDGIERMSAQIFLATTTSSCCSYKVSIVGFDPDTDFTIAPWAQSSYKETLQDYEVFVGHDLAAYAGDKLKFFDVEVTVAARLDETGTYLDTAVYTNMETAKAMVAAAEEKKLFSNAGYDIDPDSMVSCIMIRVSDGFSAAEVEGRIKQLISQVATVKTETTVENISSKLGGLGNIAVFMIMFVWLLIFIVDMIVFRLSFNSRMKEFAVFRIAGASKKQLSNLLMSEAAAVSFAGSVIGSAAALLVMELFSNQIESLLDMPYLLPSGVYLILSVSACVLVSAFAGVLAALSAAHKAGNIDAALILRREN